MITASTAGLVTAGLVALIDLSVVGAAVVAIIVAAGEALALSAIGAVVLEGGIGANAGAVVPTDAGAVVMGAVVMGTVVTPAAKGAVVVPAAIGAVVTPTPTTTGADVTTSPALEEGTTVALATLGAAETGNITLVGGEVTMPPLSLVEPIELAEPVLPSLERRTPKTIATIAQIKRKIAPMRMVRRFLSAVPVVSDVLKV